MRDIFARLSEDTKHVLDTASIATLLGSLAKLLPDIASLLTVLWLAIRLYESATVQSLLGRGPGPTKKDD